MPNEKVTIFHYPKHGFSKDTNFLPYFLCSILCLVYIMLNNASTQLLRVETESITRATHPIFNALKQTGATKFECSGSRQTATVIKDANLFDLRAGFSINTNNASSPIISKECPTPDTLVVERHGQKYSSYILSSNPNTPYKKGNKQKTDQLLSFSIEIEKSIIENQGFLIVQNSQTHVSHEEIPK